MVSRLWNRYSVIIADSHDHLHHFVTEFIEFTVKMTTRIVDIYGIQLQQLSSITVR